MIVDADRMVTLLGGGEPRPDLLNEALKRAPILVAADGAASLALDEGHVPAAVIGDFDSLDPTVRKRLPEDRLYPIEEQDSTDFDKCLRSIRAPLVLGVGFSGARLDHELAALNVLARRPEVRCLLLGPVDLCFLAPPRLVLDLAPGTRLSLFPMGPVRGTSQGLRWPIDGLDFAPDGRSGTSNEATAPVELCFERPGMLTILGQEHLDTAIAAMLAAPGWGQADQG